MNGSTVFWIKGYIFLFAGKIRYLFSTCFTTTPISSPATDDIPSPNTKTSIFQMETSIILNGKFTLAPLSVVLHLCLKNDHFHYHFALKSNQK